MGCVLSISLFDDFVVTNLWLSLSKFKTNLITLLYSPLFKRKSLIMKNISTGFGLCAIAAAVALYPVLDRFAPIAKEAHAGVPVSAITSAVMGQAAPTIVWYGLGANDVYHYGNNYGRSFLVRAWSDGRVEARRISMATIDSGTWCSSVETPCASPWYVINDPSQGYSAASDSNFDAQVDGADLALLLGNWGDAPRDQIPHSDCPLNLINP